MGTKTYKIIGNEHATKKAVMARLIDGFNGALHPKIYRITRTPTVCSYPYTKYIEYTTTVVRRALLCIVVQQTNKTTIATTTLSCSSLGNTQNTT